MKLVQNASDESAFVHLVESIVTAASAAHQTSSFYIVKIDNWFGLDWLGFNHKVLGAAGSSAWDRTSPRLVPPFNPSRVLSTHHFVRVSPVVHESVPAELHRYQSSEYNAKRSLERLMPNDGAFWWSSASRDNGRGSVMAYLPGAEGHVAWYVNFKRTIATASGGEVTTWVPAQLRGTTRRELQAYLRFEDTTVF